nr:MAG TPA: hypothetical protein [Bacteriophage sp.]
MSIRNRLINIRCIIYITKANLSFCYFMRVFIVSYMAVKRILYIYFYSLSSYYFFINRILYRPFFSLRSINLVDYSLLISLSFIAGIRCSRSLSEGKRLTYFYVSSTTPTIC